MADITYDVAIVGSGPAGYTAAIRAAQWGLKTALIERDNKLGGTCLHVGCIPTKALLFNAEIYDHVKSAAEFGIGGVGDITLDWKVVLDRKNKVITKHAKGLEFLMRKNKVDVISGAASLAGPGQNGVHTLALTGGTVATVRARNVVIATGSEARLLPGLKADDRILTNIEVLSLDRIPKSLIVVGSGAVGSEFASIFKTFGTDVTILEMLPRLVPVEDEEVSKELGRVYKKRGIQWHVNAVVQKVERTATGVAVEFTVDGKTSRIEAEKVLIAVGRKSRTEGIGLERVPKIQVERGFVHVNEFMQTGEPGIYAIGDIAAGYPQLAHAGSMEGIIAVGKIAGQPVKPINRQRIPGATYTDPQIGSVGMTEAQARAAGHDVKVGKFPFAGNSKASIIGQHDGFVKVVTDNKYGEILGIHIIGPNATELVAEAVAALVLESTAEELSYTIHAHPTLAEAVQEGVNAVYGIAINV